MNMTINIDGVQENKKYVLEFCLSSDGVVVMSGNDPKPKNKPKKSKKDSGPSIDDFEVPAPSIDEIDAKSKPKEFKIASSTLGDMKPGESI